jgi:hypothetical protein
MALSEWTPTESAEVARVAVPPLSEDVPIVAVPSLNVTEPVAEVLFTAAVSVTGCPNTEGFNDEVRLVVLGPWLTVCVRAGEVLPVKVESPLYVAVSEWEPIESAEVFKTAEPFTRVTVPRVFEPSRYETVPVPPLQLMVAVRATDWPNAEGLADDVRAVLQVPGAVTVRVIGTAAG